MKLPRDQFEDRIADVRALLATLRAIELGSPIGGGSIGSGTATFAVMKASAFIVLYNLVESTVRVAFEGLYTEIERGGHSFAGLNAEIRRVWMRQRFLGGVDLFSASAKTFLDRAELVLTDAISTAGQRLNSNELQVGGNLDAEVIRKLLKRHGVNLTLDARANGGEPLQLIKSHRNSLAHGDSTFSECGRGYTADDLERFAVTTEHFLRSMLASVEKYLREHAYAAKILAKPRRSRKAPSTKSRTGKRLRPV